MESELPKKRTIRQDRFLTAEVARFAEVMRPEYRAMVLVMTYGELRLGEAIALRPRRVDSLRRQLVVAESGTTISGKVVFGDTKTGKSRTVSVP